MILPPVRRRLLAALLVIACNASPDDGDEGGSSTGEGGATTGAVDAEPHVYFAGKVDVVDLCGVQGANVVSFRAAKVGCAKPGPCTIKTNPYQMFVGEAATCPSGQTYLDMKVRVEEAAKYQVEVRTLTDSGHLSRCYGVGGAATLMVTEEQLAAGETIHVGPIGGPCPAP